MAVLDWTQLSLSLHPLCYLTCAFVSRSIMLLLSFEAETMTELKALILGAGGRDSLFRIRY